MSRCPDGPVLAVAALIAATVANNAVVALVREPVWLESMVAVVLIGAVVLRFARRQTSMRCSYACIWLATGLAAGLTIPKSAPPPVRIITHATGGLAQMTESAVLLAALQAIDDDPQVMLGRRIIVHGLWSGDRSEPAWVSVRVMACCAADAVDAGLDVVPLQGVAFAAGTPVRVSGVVYASMHDGELRYGLAQAIVSAVAAHEKC